MTDEIIAKGRLQAKGLHNQGLEEAGKATLDAVAKCEAVAIKSKELEVCLSDLLELAQGLREWIESVPDDVAAKLPAMPGIDGDWADEVIYAAQTALKQEHVKGVSLISNERLESLERLAEASRFLVKAEADGSSTGAFKDGIDWVVKETKALG